MKTTLKKRRLHRASHRWTIHQQRRRRHRIHQRSPRTHTTPWKLGTSDVADLIDLYTTLGGPDLDDTYRRPSAQITW